jgi:RNA polymerase sigma-70 factor (ECF subfamily)
MEMMALAARVIPTPSDDELVARVREGDEAAFSALYKRHARYVAGVVYRLLGSDANLEDIVQETFVIGLRQLGSLRDGHALRRWLSTIAIRRVKRDLAARYKRRELDEELGAVMPRVTEPSAREEIHALYEALEKLPDKLRVPWILHHIEGETLPAVAELCDSSLTSVKRHIGAADKRLRRLGHEH